MGKHAAAEGASAHPIVAAALTAHPSETGGAHALDGARTGAENPLGWPAPPTPGDGGLGWPADAENDAETEAAPAAPTQVDPAPAVRRSWRRLFGARRAA